MSGTHIVVKSIMRNSDKYFMDIVHVVTSKSSCLTRKVGAIIVKDDNIVSAGYNGTPKNVPNCDEGGCPRCADRIKGLVASGEKLEYCLCAHAEINAIVFAARHGVSIDGSVLYTQGVPCSFCAKSIINGGIREVICEKADYADQMGGELLRIAGVKIRFAQM